MIPNIFISSTIRDLQYLRDGLRDVVEDLGYHPVMSEYGEVGYLRPTTAATCCYRAIEQCQMVILIVGTRYGAVGEDGLSVTHKEYLAAEERQIPIITLVEPKVLHYKEVFEALNAESGVDAWKSFNKMDAPQKTFELLNRIADSPSYNGMIEFHSVHDAKRKLKLQIADYVGNHLSGAVMTVNAQLKDVLAEIKTIRNQLAHGTNTGSGDAQKYLAVTRYLLNDNAAQYKTLLEKLFGNLDVAVAKIPLLPTFDAVLVQAGFSHEILSDSELLNAMRADWQETQGPPQGKSRSVFAQYGHDGGFDVFSNKHLQISQSCYHKFNKQQSAIFGTASVSH